MAPRALAGFALAAIFASGCDVKPDTPETGTSPAVLEASGAARGVAAGTVQVPVEAARMRDAEGTGERSIRLFGPGVSRERQIRV